MVEQSARQLLKEAAHGHQATRPSMAEEERAVCMEILMTRLERKRRSTAKLHAIARESALTKTNGGPQPTASSVHSATCMIL